MEGRQGTAVKDGDKTRVEDSKKARSPDIMLTLPLDLFDLNGAEAVTQ